MRQLLAYRKNTELEDLCGSQKSIQNFYEFHLWNTKNVFVHTVGSKTTLDTTDFDCGDKQHSLFFQNTTFFTLEKKKSKFLGELFL